MDTNAVQDALRKRCYAEAEKLFDDRFQVALTANPVAASSADGRVLREAVTACLPVLTADDVLFEDMLPKPGYEKGTPRHILAAMMHVPETRERSLALYRRLLDAPEPKRVESALLGLYRCPREVTYALGPCLFARAKSAPMEHGSKYLPVLGQIRYPDAWQLAVDVLNESEDEMTLVGVGTFFAVIQPFAALAPLIERIRGRRGNAWLTAVTALGRFGMAGGRASGFLARCLDAEADDMSRLELSSCLLEISLDTAEHTKAAEALSDLIRRCRPVIEEQPPELAIGHPAMGVVSAAFTRLAEVTHPPELVLPEVVASARSRCRELRAAALGALDGFDVPVETCVELFREVVSEILGMTSIPESVLYMLYHALALIKSKGGLAAAAEPDVRRLRAHLTEIGEDELAWRVAGALKAIIGSHG